MKKESIMVECLSENDSISKEELVDIINHAISGLTKYHSVQHVGTKALSEQGLKVWTKRKIGLSLAAPKPVKTAKPTETAEVESEELVEVGA